MPFARYRALVAPGLSVVLGACAAPPAAPPPCRVSFTLCGAECIPLAYDARNCGACGHVCAGQLACEKGVCAAPSTSLAGASGHGSVAQGGASAVAGVGGAAGAAGAPGTSSGAGAAGSAGAPSSKGGASGAGKGGSGSSTAGGASSVASGPGGASGGAVGGASGAGGSSAGNAGASGGTLACDAPLVACGPKCVDLASDDANCGACKASCPTGICQSGGCVGAAAGHRVALGLDFSQKAPDSAEQLLGSAVFLGSNTTGGHWRVLGLDPFASPSVANVDGVLAARAASHGIADLKVTHAPDAATFLSTITVKKINAVLFYDQPTAPPASLGALGAAVGAAVDTFSRAGGVVVLLTGGEGRNEMWALASAAQILPASGFSPFAPAISQLDCGAPLDPLTLGCGPFSASVGAGTWDVASGGAADSDWNVVLLEQGTKKPVGMHRAVLP